MKENQREIDQLLEEFSHLKSTVMKTNRVFKFISSKAFRMVYLFSSLIVLAYTAAMYLLIQSFGSYANIPGPIQGIYYALLVIVIAWMGTLKVQSLKNRVEELGSTISIRQLLKEVYSWSTLITVLPFIFTMIFTIVYLVGHEKVAYLLPVLSILYGLMLVSMVSFLYLREFIVGAIWFLTAGFAILFFMPRLPLLLAIAFTFGFGFLSMYIASLVFSRNDQ